MARMGWVTTADVAEFLEAAGDFLRAERARNTVLLTVAETARVNPGRYGAAGDGGSEADASGRPLFGWWTDGAAGQPVRGAFLHTPPHAVLLSAISAEPAAELAASTLAGRPVSGVNGNEDAATAFAAAWTARAGGGADVHVRTRLYRLGDLTWPDPPPEGAPRTAGDGDVALLADWFEAFAVEVHEMSAEDHEAAVREKLGYGGLTLWEARGRPVSVAGVTRQVASMVRVGPVYTPPRLRGRGYASAATAEVSRAALAAGAEEVLLYTDLANPVSNSIYQRIGYLEVEDRVALSFTG
jgi:RimJ/RimL family protein N-acetyltransferase